MTRKALQIQILFGFAALFLMLSSAQSIAQPKKSPFEVTGYPVPRFVSLSSNKVFMRAGPGKKYPVMWQYQRKGLPVEVVMEFDVWRKIRDKDNEQGWVHKSLLSGRRTAILDSSDLVEIKRRPDKKSRLMAYVEPNAMVSLDECSPQWCRVDAQGYSGWVQRKYLWGIYENETID